MVYPDNFGLIQEALERSLKEHGTIIVPEYAVKFPASQAELFMTFSPSKDGSCAVVRFWAVAGGKVVPVCPEIVFDDRAAPHEGWGWQSALEAAPHEGWDWQSAEETENLY